MVNETKKYFENCYRLGVVMFYDDRNPPSCIGGIDTLYYFADVIGENYNKIYNDLILKERFLENFEFLGYSGKLTGFVGSWFQYVLPVKQKFNGRFVTIKLFRIGFKNPDKQKKVKNIYIQLYAEGIYYFGIRELILKIEELLGSCGLIADDYYVSRADINMFVSYDFSNLKKEMFKVPSRSVTVNDNQEIDVNVDTKSHTYFVADKLETLYFGSRKSDLHFKIYDKFKELNTKSVKYLVMLSYLKNNGFTSMQPLWNIEFTLKRQALLSYGVNTLQQLFERAGNIFKDLMSKYVFLGYDVEKIQKFRSNRHLNRLSMHPLWSYLINSYNLYTSVPVRRYIKKFKDNNNDLQFEKLSIIFKDLKENTGMSYNQIFYKVRDKIVL